MVLAFSGALSADGVLAITAPKPAAVKDSAERVIPIVHSPYPAVQSQQQQPQQSASSSSNHSSPPPVHRETTPRSLLRLVKKRSEREPEAADQLIFLF